MKIDAEEDSKISKPVDHATFTATAIGHARELAVSVVESVAQNEHHHPQRV